MGTIGVGRYALPFDAPSGVIAAAMNEADARGLARLRLRWQLRRFPRVR